MTQQDATPADQPTFEPIVKDRALKMLLDYMGRRGFRWTTMCKEILRVTRPPASDPTPLTRQDLENWPKRKGIGDDKFVWVYKYLTAPETQERPEFRNAGRLLQPVFEIVDVGRSLTRVHDNVQWLKGWSVETDAHLDKREVCGTYVGWDDDGQYGYAMAIRRLPFEPFLIAHFFSGELKNLAPSQGWKLHRLSGFVNWRYGQPIFHLLNKIDKRSAVFVGLPHDADGLTVIHGQLLEGIADLGELAQSMVSEYKLELKREVLPELETIIDIIWLDMPL